MFEIKFNQTIGYLEFETHYDQLKRNVLLVEKGNVQTLKPQMAELPEERLVASKPIHECWGGLLWTIHSEDWPKDRRKDGVVCSLV